MDRINQAAFEPTPYDPTQKLPKGPSLMFDPGERAFVAEWLGHLAAGRIGGSLCGPTASLLEARNPPMSDERKEEILANERVVMGPRWRG